MILTQRRRDAEYAEKVGRGLRRVNQPLNDVCASFIAGGPPPDPRRGRSCLLLALASHGKRSHMAYS